MFAFPRSKLLPLLVAFGRFLTSSCYSRGFHQDDKSAAVALEIRHCPSRLCAASRYSSPLTPGGGISMPVRRLTLKFGRNRGSTRKLKPTLPFD